MKRANPSQGGDAPIRVQVRKSSICRLVPDGTGPQIFDLLACKATGPSGSAGLPSVSGHQRTDHYEGLPGRRLVTLFYWVKEGNYEEIDTDNDDGRSDYYYRCSLFVS